MKVINHKMILSFQFSIPSVIFMKKNYNMQIFCTSKGTFFLAQHIFFYMYKTNKFFFEYEKFYVYNNNGNYEA